MLIEERVKAGLRNARAKGKKFGRPRAQVDANRVFALRREGLSWSQVCRTLNVSKGSAQRSVARLACGLPEERQALLTAGEDETFGLGPAAEQGGEGAEGVR